ncbi:MAG: protein kinase family protein [Solirubrobacterales bacterium]
MQFFKRKKYAGLKVGKYTIDQFIGEGRYGLCFTANSLEGEKVIIKKFKPGIFKKNCDKNPFEAVILSKLQDLRIPNFLGVINEKGFYGFVLDFKKGNTVKDMLFKHHYKFNSDEIYNIGIKLISIISCLHKNGVVHRDIRISNVILDNDDVYLIDFGLARFADDTMYPFNLDYSYLGDFLLYLLYSNFESDNNGRKLPWYDELGVSNEQNVLLKRLLGIEVPYDSMDEIESDFIDAFKP